MSGKPQNQRPVFHQSGISKIMLENQKLHNQP
jgi:hypothetical protein